MKITGVQDTGDKRPGQEGKEKSNCYSCPIYANSARTDLTYVTTIQINCPKYVKKISAPPASMKKKSDGSKSKNKDFEEIDYGKIAVNLNTSDSKYWVLQGTAIICNVN